jgi:CRISPR-associated endonuclease/helicase Cas3
MSPDHRKRVPLAHSPPPGTDAGDPYERHVKAVRAGACERARAMLHHATDPPRDVVDAIETAATFHDLGKLDSANQAVLKRCRGGGLPWDHIDAGVAHLMGDSVQDSMSAWLIRAHHAPGLPEYAQHFDSDGLGRRLRGRRRDEDERDRHATQQARTDSHLQEYLSDHEAVVGAHKGTRGIPRHGLTMRLALSCLADADHTDTAFYDTGRLPAHAPPPRWGERLESLCRYVRNLPVGETTDEKARNRLRSDFFEACLQSQELAPMVACEGSVGLGKTTAVTAYLLRRAINETPNLRRLILVAPYTNILAQTADRLRKALVLPGERADEVIVEHHHRADFTDRANRDLAVLWHAPIVLTTAVSFFEALTACNPATLRKLHALPGSAVFLDEAHAALPTKLWSQNWRWLNELAKRWGCRFVFASGSLVRFWENADIVSHPVTVPELMPSAQAVHVRGAELRRVRYESIDGGRCLTVKRLISAVRKSPGPRLVVLNTVQNAGVVARELRRSGMRVLHLSTALCPGDRSCIIRRVTRSLEAGWRNWTLVATSCVEAGVDFSFRCAFRERFAVASTLQIGGRVNRHGEYDKLGGGIVYDFALDDKLISQHPEAEISADVLRDFLCSGELNLADPADLVTRAMREELSRLPGNPGHQHQKAENERNYPEVAKLGRVISADTRLVVVDPTLKSRLRHGRAVSSRALLDGSVQLWAKKIDKLGCEQLPHRGDELFLWNYRYDADFLGIMAGVLRTEECLAADACVV